MPVKRFDHILISRPDAIGDVVLTLPLAGLIKQHYPSCKVSFLGRNYTRDVVACCKHVDAFFSLDDWQDDLEHQLSALTPDVIIHAFPHKAVVKAAKAVGISDRVGTAKRWHSFTAVNRRHWFSRKNSDQHEAQLNARLLSSIGIQTIPSLTAFSDLFGFEAPDSCPIWLKEQLTPNKPNLIFHPKSKGSAVDWPLEKWGELIEAIPEDQANIFISGTAAEGELIRKVLPLDQVHVHDITGKLSLREFIGFIGISDGLVACSTGPLHIASAVGKFALGLYTNQRPMHAGRWAPLGRNARVLEAPHEGSALPFQAADVLRELPI